MGATILILNTECPRNLNRHAYYSYILLKDREATKKYYSMAATQGNTNAMINLARSYYYGLFTESDYGKAIYWYKKSLADKKLAKNLSIKKKIKLIEKEIVGI
ncbi:MAG: sel1 repeat family protein [Candidatus Caenarcaniphilales bacterium]|nr:sel1 repeat family protein [Candidatus Caenarcaniphilales bacterium]